MEPAAILAVLQPYLPILAPLLVAALKFALPQILERVPVLARPILSALLGALIAWLSGYLPGAIEVGAGGIATGAGLGLAGAKARDIAVGKPYSAHEPEPWETAGVRG